MVSNLWLKILQQSCVLIPHRKSLGSTCCPLVDVSVSICEVQMDELLALLHLFIN